MNALLRWFRRPLRYACLRRAEAWTLRMLAPPQPPQPPHFAREAHRGLWDLYRSGALPYEAYAYEVASLDRDPADVPIPSVCDHNWVFDANTGWRCSTCGDPKPGQADPSAVYDSEWRDWSDGLRHEDCQPVHSNQLGKHIVHLDVSGMSLREREGAVEQWRKELRRHGHEQRHGVPRAGDPEEPRVRGVLEWRDEADLDVSAMSEHEPPKCCRGCGEEIEGTTVSWRYSGWYYHPKCYEKAKARRGDR